MNFAALHKLEALTPSLEKKSRVTLGMLTSPHSNIHAPGEMSSFLKKHFRDSQLFLGAKSSP